MTISFVALPFICLYDFSLETKFSLYIVVLLVNSITINISFTLEFSLCNEIGIYASRSLLAGIPLSGILISFVGLNLNHFITTQTEIFGWVISVTDLSNIALYSFSTLILVLHLIAVIILLQDVHIEDIVLMTKFRATWIPQPEI